MVSTEERKDDPNFQYGNWLSSPAAGEEVVISGMSGRLPESNTIHEFRDHLFSKREMVSDDYRRWQLDHPEIPQRTAKIYNIDKYDAGFFGVHFRQADVMDPMMRTFMETAIEAVMDAGINPSELAGSKTGVFVSTSWSDMENDTYMNISEPERFAVTGYLRSLIAHRVSYYLKLKGPAVIIDTACSSSMNAFDTAFKAIRSGQCDNALVGCANLLLHPGNSLQFFRLGVLSVDGVCRVFDQNASGYVRGETIACLFLQKAKNSRRIYARIINTKINSDGFKEQGITFPSTLAQKQLMTELYSESEVHPSDLSFLEAHGTGTEVGDPEEVEAIDSALAKKRQESLLVGSVKSSIGHTEPCSGVCSIIKVLLAMETGIITPNINLKKIKKGMDGFEQGRMKAVTELTKLGKDDAIIGINNFGFGGNNGHAILRGFKKEKSNQNWHDDELPRLVCVSGRTEQIVKNLINDVNSKNFDPEYVALLHHMYKSNIQNHLYRGYTIISKSGPIKTSIKFTGFEQSQLYLLFGEFTNNFKVLGSYLIRFPIFQSTVSRMNLVLQSKNVHRFEQLLKKSPENGEDILCSVCVQIGIVDVLKHLEIFPNAVYGDSYGSLVSAYYYKVISLEEAVSTAIKISHLESQTDVQFQSQLKNLDILQNQEKSRGGILLQDLTRKSYKNIRIFNISDRSFIDRDLLPVEGNTVMFLDNLGRLYEEGHIPQLYKLYPEVEFPVSRSTEMISPSIQWDHRKSWYTYKFSEFSASDAEQREYNISFFYDEYKFIGGHVIDGRNLFPATEYLNLVWQTFAQSRRLLTTDLPVTFADCKFIRAVTMPKSGFVKMLVTIQRGSGTFEVLEKNSLVVSGVIRICTDMGKHMIDNQEALVFDEKNKQRILEKDEIYREMYLRGYNYSGVFKGIEKCNVDATAGLIKWENNWSSFMDKMLQMKILQTDTRLLYVPVGIKKLVIDPAKHVAMAEKFGKNEILFPVHVYKECNVIRSGGFEICGLQAKSIVKKKPRLDPVLEKYEFVPNSCLLSVPEAVRVNTQIILENHNESNFKAVEIVDDPADADYKFLMYSVCKALDDTPIITPDLIISSKNIAKEVPGIKFESVTLTPESNILLIVGTKILQHPNNLKQIFLSLNRDGFVLTREEIDFVPSQADEEIEIVTNFTTSDEKLILFKRKNHFENSKIIKVSSNDFQWLSDLKESLKHDSIVTVYCKNEEYAGVLGLVKCIRREPNGHKIRCFLIMDEAPEFDPTHEFYSKQIDKNLSINIYKNRTWGTYRHLPLEENSQVDCGHCFVNVTSRGDISSLRWLEGPLTEETPLEKNRSLVAIYYSAVNFKDIMAASGRVNVEALTTKRINQEYLIGFEFSGRDLSGRRVTGMIDSRAIASHVIAHTNFLWDIPDSWTLEDAATVPVVYSTVMYALLMVEDLKIGASVLIHSGTGGIGLAALNVCLHYKCDVYVTVGTEEKREYLKKHYPQIPESHIGNSRDTSFEKMIKTQTQDRGVDVVLNSLSDDKLRASVRCLAEGGRLLEIGKFDLANDTSLNLLLMEKKASYHGIMLDRIFTDSEDLKVRLVRAIYDGIRTGFVKPLPRRVFEREEIENSYRYMMTGKHMGKVLVKVRDEEEDKVAVPRKRQFKAEPRFNCDLRCSYVIIGGLGGIGLELADWLVLRGAKKLLLVSRSGIQNGYQFQRIRTWKSYGVKVQISTKDVTSKQGCFNLMQEANDLGVVDAVFNLAVVLKDAFFEDQSEENFIDSLAPKAHVTEYLDEVTRKLCPKLRYFVVFSSVSCGRGNVGQSNYGMANAIMEEICEKRRLEGFPALAIQWGAIGDVGLVAKMQKENKEFVIGGTLQQKISSCLEVLDRFLKQDHPIVSSMVVAEKYSRDSHSNPVEAVAYILGIKDMKTISQHVTLAELGMDSMMGTEVINVLEKDFDIYITAKDVRSLTFAKIGELETEKKHSVDVKVQQGTNMFIQLIPDSSVSHLPIIKLESLVSCGEECSNVFVLPGIEGVFRPLEPLTKQLNANVFGVQYNYKKPENTVREVAEGVVSHIENHLVKGQPFVLIGYSFGGVVALDTVSLLERKGYQGKLVVIDGSPTYLSASVKEYLPEENEAEFQTGLIFKLMAVLVPLESLPQYKDKFLKCGSWSDRVDLALTLIPPEVPNRQKLEKQAALVLYKRFKAIINYKFPDEKISSSVHVFKARYSMAKEEEDHELTKLCEKEIGVSTVDGDHVTILTQPELANGINRIIEDLK